MENHNERLAFICTCESLEHQLWIWYDAETNSIYVEPYLHTERNFFQRLWYGLKYAFGYKSQFGAFDEMILDEDDMDKMYEYIKNSR